MDERIVLKTQKMNTTKIGVTEDKVIQLARDERQKVCLGIFKKEEGKSMIMNTIFNELSEEMGTSISFYSLEPEQANRLTQQYSIQIIPSFLLFEEGELREIYSGLISKSDLKTSIGNIIENKSEV